MDDTHEPIHGQRIETDYTGQHIAGRYQVQQHIGRGGMADVYRAHDERLCCDVALKFLKPRLASEEWCARMFQEARASAAIDHPHVLRITDVGRVGPSIYMAMDLLTGASLETVLCLQPEHRLPWRRAVELFLPVLAAFQAAHEAGFIHRDIKPDNLFLRRQGNEQRLIVLDFGIVKHIPGGAHGPGLPTTATGYVLGTPAYMSPEQASGLPLGPGTDIYSVAVTLYRVLSGRLPFIGVPGEPFVVLTKHIYEDPPPLFAPGAAPENFPARLEAVILRALAKRPEGRPASMAELAAEMAACLTASAHDPTVLGREPLVIHDGEAHTSTLTRSLPRTSTRSEPLPVFGSVPVIAAIASILLGWPLTPAEGATPSGLAADDVPTVLCAPTYLVRPSAPPHEPRSSGPLAILPDTAPELPPPPRRRDPRALRAIMAGMMGAVQRCVLAEGDADAVSIAVEVALSPAGTVLSTSAGDRDASLVSHCIADATRGLRFGAGPAQRFRHTFELRRRGTP